MYDPENYVIWDIKSMGMKDINGNSTSSNGTQLQTNVENKRWFFLRFVLLLATISGWIVSVPIFVVEQNDLRYCFRL